MGSNDRLDGVCWKARTRRATLEVLGEPLIGRAHERQEGRDGGRRHAASNARVSRASTGRNRLAMPLKAAMYLGERWELWFERGRT